MYLVAEFSWLDQICYFTHSINQSIRILYLSPGEIVVLQLLLVSIEVKKIKQNIREKMLYNISFGFRAEMKMASTQAPMLVSLEMCLLMRLGGVNSLRLT